MHIYVIGSGPGPKKIGLSGNPEVRRMQFQGASSRPLRVLHSRSIDPVTARHVESFSHHYLHAVRRSGEWFEVTLAEAIQAIDKAVAAVACGGRMKAAVGRPLLNVKPILIRLPDGFAERIEAVAGKHRKAEFIREAVERELKRRERSTTKNVDGRSHDV